MRNDEHGHRYTRGGDDFDTDPRSNSGWQGGGYRERGQHYDQSSAFDGESTTGLGNRRYSAESQFGYGGDRASSQQNRYGSRRTMPKGYTRSDERIREDVCERLSHSGLDVGDVSVEVSQANVRLEGTVKDRYVKHAIEDCADDCMGVQDIDNRIRVQKESSLGGGQSASEWGQIPTGQQAADQEAEAGAVNKAGTADTAINKS